MGNEPTPAPRPGVGRRAEEATTDPLIATIKFRGEEHTLAYNLVPLSEKLVFLEQVGVDYEELTFRKRMYVTSFAPLVWLSKRANGEPDLTFAEFCKDWPDDLMAREITCTVSLPDESASDPEA